MKIFIKIILFWQFYCHLVESREQFTEKLILKTHTNGQISGFFNFKIFVPLNIDLPWISWNTQTNADLFPLSLVRLFQKNDVQELHFGMVQGRWRYNEWGLPPRDSPSKTQLSVWFNTYLNSEKNWQRILSHLSGQFCASLNQIKPHITVKPKFSFRPFIYNHQNVSSQQKYAYHAMLPQEVVCTENLTPWTKLLPCKSQKGLADLLIATRLLNTLFFSLSLDFKYSCSDISDCQRTQGIELSQNILVVFDPPNKSKSSFDWSIRSLFGQPLSAKSLCPLASSSDIFVELSPNSNLTVSPQTIVVFDEKNNVIRERSFEDSHNEFVQNSYARFDLKELLKRLKEQPEHQKYINIAMEYSKDTNLNSFNSNRFNHLQVRRNFRGTGLVWAGLSTTVVNRQDEPIFMTYLDTIPWYFRMFLHTLRVQVRSIDADDFTAFTTVRPEYIHYQPAKNRERPHHLEMIIQVPARSEIEIDFEFERQFLRWPEYPPDSNHGLYISPATLTFYKFNSFPSNLNRFVGTLLEALPTARSSDSTTIGELNKRLSLLSDSSPVRIYTDPVLVSMPTPDFSMPFNVICLVCSLFTVAFGPFFSISTNRPTLIVEKTSSRQGGAIKKMLQSVRTLLRRPFKPVSVDKS